MILAGELPAGSKLNEAAIAERLGVSRGPVREAFRALEESGLVELEKNRGVFVRRIPIEEADEIYELRAVLDEFVGRRLAQIGVTPSTCASSPIASTGWSAPPAKGDVEAYLAANVEFHDRLVELAGNAKLLGMYRRLVNELHLFRHATLAQGGVLPVSTREHRAIVERIAARPAGRRRARALRSRHGEPRADAPRARLPRRRSCRRGPAHPRGNPGDSRLHSPSTAAPIASRRGRSSSPASTAASPNTSTRRSPAAARRSSRRCARPARASPPIASSRRSPIRTTCRSSPARRPRCTASAATTSGTAMPAPK